MINVLPIFSKSPCKRYHNCNKRLCKCTFFDNRGQSLPNAKTTFIAFTVKNSNTRHDDGVHLNKFYIIYNDILFLLFHSCLAKKENAHYVLFKGFRYTYFEGSFDCCFNVCNDFPSKAWNFLPSKDPSTGIRDLAHYRKYLPLGEVIFPQHIAFFSKNY